MAKHPGGRPSKYTQKLADAILDRIANGDSLRTICKGNPDMPAVSTILKWKLENPVFSEQYDEARQSQAQHLFDQLIEIADSSTGETQRDRLRVDTRKWYLSKVAPKVYGDKLELAGDKDNPIELNATVTLKEAENALKAIE